MSENVIEHFGELLLTYIIEVPIRETETVDGCMHAYMHRFQEIGLCGWGT